MRPFIKYNLILAVIVSSLSACTHTRSTRLDGMIDSWQGHDPDQLVKVWGAPSSTFTLREGGKVLTYQHSRLATRMYYYRYPENVSDSYTCKVNFHTDADQTKITGGNFQGDPTTCLAVAVPAP